MGTILFILFILIGFCVSSTPLQRYQGSDCNFNTRLVQQVSASLYGKLTLDGRKIIILDKSNGTGGMIREHDSVSGFITSERSLGALDIEGWSSDCPYQVSPKGEMLILWCSQAYIINLKQEQLQLSPISHSDPEFWASWSPDETLVATANSTVVTIWCSTNRSVTAYINVDLLLSLCWSPGEFLVILSRESGEGSVAWYYSNGTLFSSITDLVFGDSWMACNSLSTVAIGGLTLVEKSGRVIQRDEGGFGPNWDHQHDRLLTCRNDACTIYDSDLTVLLELPEMTSVFAVVGFTPDQRIITINSQGTSWWDIETPQVDRLDFPLTATLEAIGVGWLDRDTFLIWEDESDTAFKQYNVRTRQYSTSYPRGNSSCVMNGELYNLFYNDGMIVVFGNGSEQRRWYGGGDTVGCANNYVWMTDKTTTISIWNKMGELLQLLPLTVDEDIYYVDLYNNSQFAVVTQNRSLHIWNSVTNQLDLLEASSDVYGMLAQWSPDGNWLFVFLRRIWTLGSFDIVKIYRYDGHLLLQTTSFPDWFDDQHRGRVWSADGHWALVSSPPLLISPKLNKTISSGVSDGYQAFFNPETKEIITLSDILSEMVGVTLRLWSGPTPAILELVANKQVGSTSSSSISLIGANFFSPSSSPPSSSPSSPAVKTMLHWLDSSSNTAQCMFINAIVVNAFTLSLGNITLPDPATYTVHIRFPTRLPSSPWLNSEYQFTTVCGGATRPTLNKTGGVTTCACPYSDDGGAILPSNKDSGDLSCSCPRDYYMVPRLQELKCEQCPDHGRCDGSPVVLSEAGYWPTTENLYHFLPCAVGACLEGSHCAPCHEGPVCGLCKPGCGQYGFGRCNSCNPDWVDILLVMVGLLGWIVFCTIQSLFALGWRNKLSRGNNSSQLFAIIVSTTQVNALLLSVDVKVDSISKILGFSEDAVQGGGFQSSVLSCILINSGWSPSHVHMVKQVIWLLLPCLGWAVLVALRACLRCKNIATSNDLVKVPTVVLWSSLQSAITTSLLQTFSCTEVSSQDFGYRLKHDISVACYGNTYWLFIALVTIPAFLATIIIIPISIAWLLKYRPSASASGHLRFLVKSYRFDWWYLATFYRKVLLCLVVTFTKNPFHVALTLFMAATVNVFIWPSTSFLVNISETTSLMASIFIFGLAGAIDNQLDNTILIEILGVGIFSYCVQIGLLVYDRWRVHDSEGKDKDDDLKKSSVILEPLEQQREQNGDRDGEREGGEFSDSSLYTRLLN